MQPSDSQKVPLIVIVDDDESVRRALGRLVEALGMRVESHASPRALLERGHAREPSCLLLDVQLPGMSGFELHERLRARGLQAPVIFVTGHPDEEARTRARAAGAMALLEKPVDDRDLIAALDRALLWELARRSGSERDGASHPGSPEGGSLKERPGPSVRPRAGGGPPDRR
jgi:FixJ family two-component response regulator